MRKKTEEELRKAEGFLENVFASIQDGIGILDKDMNIIRVNPAAQKWYPHVTSFMGKKCYEAFHGRSQRCEICPVWRTLRTGEAAYDVVAKHGQGGKEVGWIEIYSFPRIDTATGVMEGVIEYVRDITERRRFEKALKESEEQYRSLFEDSPISLWEEDSSSVKKYIDILRNKGVEDFRRFFESHPEEVERCAKMVKVVNVNKATLSMFRARSKEELLKGLNNIFSEHSYDIFREELVAIAEGRTEFEGEDFVRTMTGDVLQIYMKWSVAPGHEGTIH